MPQQTARSVIRAGFDVPTRLKLLEDDVDTIDGRLDELVSGQKRITQMLVGVLISVATGAIMLAINLIVQAGAK